MHIRKSVAGLAATAAAALTVAGLAGPAQAVTTGSKATPSNNGTAAAAEAPHGFFTANGVRIRKGPSTGRVVLGKGYKGQRITVHCLHAGNPANWWRITNRKTGVTGYVYWPDNVLLDNTSPMPPNC